MPVFLDTTGKSTLGIGVCARCGVKMSLDDLREDPNYPGLRVCQDDYDQRDPWTLPARETENITLEYPRPDLDLSPVTSSEAPLSGGALPSTYLSNVVWAALAAYGVGQQMTPLDPDNPNTTIPIMQFTALNAGTTGAIAPTWPTETGVTVMDGTIRWAATGIYIM